MSNTLRVLIAAVAVVAVIAIAINLLPDSASGVGGASSTAHPAASPTTGPAALPTTGPEDSPTRAASSGTLGPDAVGSIVPAGAYRVGDPFAAPFTISAPIEAEVLALSQGEVVIGEPSTGLAIGVYVPDGTYADPCHAEASPRDILAGSGKLGRTPTVDHLIEVLGSMAGFAVDSVTDITFDGLPGKAITLTNSVADDAECTFGRMLPVFTFIGGTPQGAATNPSLTEHFWLIEAGERPVVIVPDSSATTFDELDPLVQSIDFDD
jgi:hypothetical protein